MVWKALNIGYSFSSFYLKRPFQTRYEWTAEADGEKRIFFKMTMWPADDKSKVSKGIMELVKGENGKYVIYRDYFEP